MPALARGATKLEKGCGKVKQTQGGRDDLGVLHSAHDRALTVSPPFGYLFKLDSERMTPMARAARNGTDIQSTQPEAAQQARVPCAESHEGWTQDTGAQAQARACAAGRDHRRKVGTEATAAGEALPRQARIRLSTEIRALLERGKRKRTPSVDVFFAPSPASRSRLGLIVPKHGRKIVERNLVKRRLREIGRREILPELDAAGRQADLMIRARWRAYEASYEELSREVRGAVHELCSEDS